MSLMKYQPWSMFDQLHKDINNLFDRQYLTEQDNRFSFDGRQWQPAVDIKETNEAFLIRADIPGVNPEEIDVSTESGQLTIRGERKQEIDESEDGIHRVERYYGNFVRSFSLPDNVDVNAISAKSANGVLELTLPKSASEPARKIKIGQ